MASVCTTTRLGRFLQFTRGCRGLGTSSSAGTERALSLEEIVSFCKRRGFVFPGSELYGSIGTGYDYGPLGAALKKNIQDAWWKDFIERRPDCLPMESSLLMNPRVWEASGHVEQFVDPLTECSSCHSRVRADKLVKSTVESRVTSGRQAAMPSHLQDPAVLGSLGLAELSGAITALGIACPACGAKGEKGLGRARTFNLLFSTHVGPVMPEDQGFQRPLGGSPPPPESSAHEPENAGRSSHAKKPSSKPGSNPNGVSYTYLRPETAQGVYVNFKSVMSTLRRKLPLGIGQVGKSFRNEIATSNFVFRTREFDQMELQYFCEPSTSSTWFSYWVDFCERWLLQHGLSSASVRRKEYGARELAHYALATTDLEFRYPFGWEELWGIANRGDFDLRAHSASSGTELVYQDPTLNNATPFFPHAVEPAVGVNRLMLAFLCDGLVEQTLPATGHAVAAAGEPSSGPSEASSRLVLRLHDRLAPFKAAVLPVVKNKEPIVQLAGDLHARMLQHLPVEYDETQSIGKRYRRQDEIGTPLCLTVDNQSVEDGTVTIRCRDSMQQVRLHVEDIVARCGRHDFSRASLEPVFSSAPSRAPAL